MSKKFDSTKLTIYSLKMRETFPLKNEETEMIFFKILQNIQEITREEKFNSLPSLYLKLHEKIEWNALERHRFDKLKTIFRKINRELKRSHINPNLVWYADDVSDIAC